MSVTDLANRLRYNTIPPELGMGDLDRFYNNAKTEGFSIGYLGDELVLTRFGEPCERGYENLSPEQFVVWLHEPYYSGLGRGAVRQIVFATWGESGDTSETSAEVVVHLETEPEEQWFFWKLPT